MPARSSSPPQSTSPTRAGGVGGGASQAGGRDVGAGAHPNLDQSAQALAALAAALDPIITIDPFGVIQSASESVRRVFGWTPDELVGRNVNILMPEPHHAAHDGYLSNYRRTGHTHIMGVTREFEAVRKSGERFPIELSVSRADTPSSGLPLFVGIIRDISERKRLERELRLLKDIALTLGSARGVAEARTEALRLICQASGWDHGELWVPDASGQELTCAAAWSASAETMAPLAESVHSFRFARDSGIAGRAWASGQVVWLGDLSTCTPEELPRCALARRAGLRTALAVPVMKGSQAVKVLLLFAAAGRTEDLHLIELARAAAVPLAVLIDRKRVEAELEEHRRELEARVEARSAELLRSQERLRMADRLASIGTLAAGLGHDMNNVLLPVRAHLNALQASGKTGNLPRADLKHVEEVSKSVAYLQQLADGLHFLAMNPETEGDSPGGGGVTNLRQWWSQAGALLSKAVPKHARVSASFSSDLPLVAVAAHSLTQAVLNLVVNSGESIPPPSVRKRRQGHVRLWAESVHDSNGAWVRLGVTDNGTGMSEEVKRRAFEMFFTTKPRGLGTGLGLALVRRVAEHNGGRVEIESELGKGTTVLMVLPAAAAPDADATSRPVAVISIANGRAAALIRHLLESGGTTVRQDAGGDGAELWIVDPATTALDDVKTWRSKTPGGRLVVFGAPSAQSLESWLAFDPITIDAPDDFEALRTALTRATSR